MNELDRLFQKLKVMKEQKWRTKQKDASAHEPSPPDRQLVPGPESSVHTKREDDDKNNSDGGPQTIDLKSAPPADVPTFRSSAGSDTVIMFSESEIIMWEC